MRKFLFVVAAMTMAGTAMAQQSRNVSIREIRTGWDVDSFAVVSPEPIINPAGCPNPDGYITQKGFPGYSTYYAAALTAQATKRRVVVVVSNTECWAERPKIIGLNIQSE